MPVYIGVLLKCMRSLLIVSWASFFLAKVCALQCAVTWYNLYHSIRTSTVLMCSYLFYLWSNLIIFHISFFNLTYEETSPHSVATAILEIYSISWFGSIFSPFFLLLWRHVLFTRSFDLNVSCSMKGTLLYFTRYTFLWFRNSLCVAF